MSRKALDKVDEAGGKTIGWVIVTSARSLDAFPHPYQCTKFKVVKNTGMMKPKNATGRGHGLIKPRSLGYVWPKHRGTSKYYIHGLNF
jgi:hypothetical protein